jgi:hypothetical protein
MAVISEPVFGGFYVDLVTRTQYVCLSFRWSGTEHKDVYRELYLYEGESN